MVTDLELQLLRKVDKLEREILRLKGVNTSQKKIADERFDSMYRRLREQVRKLVTEKRIMKNYNASMDRARKDRKDYLETYNTEYVIQQVSLICGIPVDVLKTKQTRGNDTQHIRDMQYIIYYLLRVYVSDSLNKIFTMYTVYDRSNSDYIFARVEEMRIKSQTGVHLPHPVIQEFKKIINDKRKFIKNITI